MNRSNQQSKGDVAFLVFYCIITLVLLPVAIVSAIFGGISPAEANQEANRMSGLED